ncbi:MAG TPA: type II toxin-antitoxin system prevent-host-death family antitoxin [Gemmatimonadaceae bacterium]|nr:type II toxin-antitoxin system prevent-host-death family antitoxin [Gemmatimonadaceae bacterium]
MTRSNKTRSKRVSAPAEPAATVGESVVPPNARAHVREAVSLYDAKTQLSSLVERAAAGEEFVISKSGKPKALLVPLDDTRPLRRPGRGRGQWRVSRDFDAPLPPELLDRFGA